MHTSDLSGIPRIRLARLPTPLAKVNSGWAQRNLYVKRDDLTGLGLTGNKVRKIEFLLADARACGADTLVTCGAVQSNCARALAVAASMSGISSVLILTGDASPKVDGNLLIDRLVGSEVYSYGDISDEERTAAMERAATLVRRRGGKPYIIPFGGSSEVGSLGYIEAAMELGEQLRACGARARCLVTALASGGTFAGLYIGCRLAGLDLQPVGAYVLGSEEYWTPTLVELIRRTAARFKFDVKVDEGDIHLIDARGAGYGQPTAAELETIVRFTRRTGLLLDPIYTGKALHALERAILSGELEFEGDLAFLHTGGLFGIFAHSGALEQAIGRVDRDSLAVPA